MGIEVVVEGLTKSFGSHVVWQDVSLSLPAGEVSVMLGPSGTGKTVFLKALVGLVRPDRGSVLVDGIDTASCPERQLYQARKLFGAMFQDGARFRSLDLYDNIGMLFRGKLVMFGPREVLLTSEHPVITQFVNGRRVGPIGMSEEKDEATLAMERADEARGGGQADNGLPALVPQLVPTAGLPERMAVHRRTALALSMLHTQPPPAREAIIASLPADEQARAAHPPGAPQLAPAAEPGTPPPRARRS